MDAFKELCEQYRRVKVPTRRRRAGAYENNYLILQAEDELAAIGMVIGASWNGARAFTSTSGPGISLMSELIGLAYYAEIPAVIVDVQRIGPSTGMPTRTQQGDILVCAYASHGDTKHILLFPANPAECFEFAVQAFDLAERFQTPVFMLTRPRHRDERLGRARARRGTTATAPTAAACSSDEELEAHDEVLPLLDPEDETTSPRARCPASPRRARSSRAARATTSSAATPRSPTSTRR